MKNNTLRGVLTALSLSVGIAALAQSPRERANIIKNYDPTLLDSLAVSSAEKFTIGHQKALELAKINNWPLTIEKDGTFSELMTVNEDNNPVYYQTSNEGSAITSRVDKLYSGGGLGLNLKGQGMIAGVWDHNHPRQQHVDFSGRLTILDGSALATSTHSTHVTGTILGSGVNNSDARGMAYEANGWVNSWTNDTAEMTQEAGYGLLLSNHSYGNNTAFNQVQYYGAYRSDAREIDALTFAADKYQPVFAAGNDREEWSALNPNGGGNDLLTGNNTAKNGIVVAAVGQVLNYTSPSSVNIASFSNYGPTDDFRIKPDISAKGLNVFSATDSSTTSYGSLNGTSMASPGITGALLLLQQHYGNLNQGDEGAEYMLSSTLRGVMSHTASEAGPADGPDHMFGWGLMNAEAAANLISGKGTPFYILDERVLSQGAPYTINVYATGLQPLEATLAWTDRPGTANNSTVNATTSRLVNNLDIRITRNADVYFPWKLTNDLLNPVAVKGDNNADNIEKVKVAATAGIYTITVSHKGTLSGGSQKYSLIVSGINQTLLSDSENSLTSFSVWPNPANDILNIRLENEPAEDVFATVYDINGRRVAEQKLSMSGQTASINVEALSKGIYFVKVNSGEKQEVKKVIIN